MTKKAAVVYGKMLAFSHIKITSDDFDALGLMLKKYQKDDEYPTPVVLEYAINDQIADKAAFFDALLEVFLAHNMAVIGVVDGAMNQIVIDRRIAIFPASGKRINRLEAQSAALDTKINAQSSDNTPHDTRQDVQKDAPSVCNQSATFEGVSATNTQRKPTDINSSQKNLVYTQLLRAGQSVHNMDGDVIITSGLNDGTEAISAHNLHIYGKARGRLIAGATGDESCSIFCQVFEPNLVSVAGTYCLEEDIPKEYIGRAVQVSFNAQNGLVFQLMNNK